MIPKHIKLSSTSVAIIGLLCICFWCSSSYVRFINQVQGHDSDPLDIHVGTNTWRVNLSSAQLEEWSIEQSDELFGKSNWSADELVERSSASDPQHKFKPLNQGRSVVTFHDVCIENDPSMDQVQVDMGVTARRKIIKVYSSSRNEVRNVKVGVNSNRLALGQYKISFSTDRRPSNFTLIEDYPAYFLIPSCTANLHHFWADGAEGLYKIMKLTNRLGSKVANQLYYKTPHVPTKYTRDCEDTHRYEEILFTFPIRKFHQTYHAEQSGTCYRNAVFGWIGVNDHYTLTVEANHHIFRGMLS